jgi:L-malate glycosyltransferase
MRVLYVSHTSLVSGAERALLDLLAALPPTVEPVLATPAGDLADRASQLGVRVSPLPNVSGSLRLGVRQTTTALTQLATAAATVRSIVSWEAPDLIHANSVRSGLMCGGALVRNQPVLVHCHDVLPNSLQAKAIRVTLAHSVSAIAAISEYVARPWRNHKIPVEVVHNPLDTRRFDPERVAKSEARTQLGLNQSDQLIGVVAQITPWKGQEIAIKVLGDLQERFPDLRLLIIGSPKFTSPNTRFDNLAYLHSLHALVERLGLLGRVEFWGDREDVDVVIRALDVMLAPSWNEPFGRSVIEAMALGTPVIATSVGGPAEYIDRHKEGWLVDPHDQHGWTTALAESLEGPDEAGVRARRASQHARTAFDRDTYARHIHALYERLLKRSYPHALLEPERNQYVAPRPAVGAQTRFADGQRPTRSIGRLRVLFVEHSSVISGAQHSLMELMRTLGVDHEVALACPPGELAEMAKSYGVRCLSIRESQLTFRVTSSRTLRELINAFVARSSIRGHVAEFRPDIVHANSERAGLLAWTYGLRNSLVIHVRDLPPSGAVNTLVSRFVLTGSSSVIAVSRAVANRLSTTWHKGQQVTVIDNPIDASRFDPDSVDRAAAQFKLGLSGGPILGIVAQITPWKGQDRAIRILDHVRRRHPEAKLIVAGEPKFVTRATRFDNISYEQQLRQLVTDRGLESSVLFIGESRNVPEVLAVLDVLLVPSTEEPFGRTVVEAMAMQLPVIATDRGGPPEVIRQGLDGFCLPTSRIEAWSDAASLLAARGGRADSRRYARERFGPARHAESVLAVYARVLARDGRRLDADRISAG